MFLLLRKVLAQELVVVDEKHVSGAAMVGRTVTIDESEEEAEILAKGGKRAMETAAKAPPKKPTLKEKKSGLKVSSHSITESNGTLP